MWWEESNHLEVVNNKLFLGGKSVIEMANNFGTPIYIYSLNRIKDRYLRLKDSLTENNLSNNRIHYALKANNNAKVIKYLFELGAGIDATSPGEVQFAKEIGFGEKDIIFTGTSLSNQDLDYLATIDVLVNFDSISSIRRFRSYEDRNIGLRINSGIGLGRTEKVTTGGEEIKGLPVKFGIKEEQIDRAIYLVQEKNLKIKCIHHHVGSDWLDNDIDRYIDALEKLLTIKRKMENKLNYTIDIVDLGGGIGLPHSREEKEFSLDRFFSRVRSCLKEYNIDFSKIIIEPGNYLVGDSGILVARVNTVEKKGNKTFVGLDVGLNVFNSPSLYNYYHEIIISNRVCNEKCSTYTVVGNICETGDIFAIDRKLPPVKEGDCLTLLNAGAYGAVMSSNYNLRPQGKEIIIEGDNIYEMPNMRYKS